MLPPVLLKIFSLALAGALTIGCGMSPTGGSPKPSPAPRPDPNPKIIPPDLDWKLTPVVTDLDFPVALEFAPDGRVFYLEYLTGHVKTLDSNNWSAPPQEWCQFALGSQGEIGLTGIAIDPGFAANKRVYFFYTDPQLNNLAVRTTEENEACANETTLLSMPSSLSHNGGSLHVGPDGKLYITIGDLNAPENSQNLSHIAGKILRINTDGSVPSDNPFFNTPGARPEIWVYGLRNSFNFTFHPLTGDLWATENGPDRDDEVNRITPGRNYGWPFFTGIGGEPAYADPLVAYSPPISPTGIVALGNSHRYGIHSNGAVIFVDFNFGQVHRLRMTAANPHVLRDHRVMFAGGPGLIGLTLGRDGYLYATDFSTIYRIEIDSE